MKKLLDKYPLAIPFWMVVSAYILFTWVINKYVISSDLFYHSLGEKMTKDRIDSLLKTGDKWKIFTYLSVPISILLKLTFTALCLYIVTIFSNKSISFRKLFRMAVLAEFVFVFATFLKVIAFLFILKVNNLEDLNYSLFSVHSLFDPNTIEPYFNYLFQTINLFEIAYWFTIAFLLQRTTHKSYWKSFEFVLSTYGFGLLMWILFLSFISLNVN
jgi:hypothetical protein